MAVLGSKIRGRLKGFLLLGLAAAAIIVAGVIGLRLGLPADWRADTTNIASCRSSWPLAAPQADAPDGMVWIPGGTATIGSNKVYREEAPARSVAVEGFWMDRFEVTNAQFSAFVAATGYVTSAERAKENGFPANGSAVFTAAITSGDGWSFIAGADWRHPDGPRSSIAGRDDDPVVQVSLQDAMAYAAWMGRTLPTEEQWEYAARAGLQGDGDGSMDPPMKDGAYSANTWQGFFPFTDEGADGHMGRAPVGCFPANAFGLHDMIGNVWEWTRSPYYPTHRPTQDMRARPQGFDPRQPGVPVGVLKGGSYLCAENFCRRYRPAARHAQETGLGTNHIGFRTVFDPGRRAD